MRHNKFATLLCVLFTVWGGKWTMLCAAQEEDTWIEPNAWDREQELSKNDLNLVRTFNEFNCETKIRGQTAQYDDGMALVYFKKFIATLFNRKKLQYLDGVALYQRSILFTIDPAQLEQLEQLNDPRDLDMILNDILASARSSQHDAHASMGIYALVWDILKDLAQLLRITEVQFTVLVLICILLGSYIHRRYHFGIIKMIIVSFLLFGYFVTYLECNRKMEVEQMLEVMEKLQSELQPSWYSPVTKWFSPNEQTKQARNEKIKKASKLNLAYCRPDHVLLLYANELFLSQLEFLLEKCIGTFITLKESLSFPYNYLAAFMLIFMIAYFVKLTFKYILSPKAWAAFMSHSSSHSQQNQQHHSTPICALHEDRVSGDNLKLLLHAIVSPKRLLGNSDGVATKSQQPISGVQEILEQFEEASQSSSSSANTSLEATALEESDNTDNAKSEKSADDDESTRASIESETKSCVDKSSRVAVEDKPRIILKLKNL